MTAQTALAAPPRRPRFRIPVRLLATIAVVLLIGGGLVMMRMQRADLARRLLATSPLEVASHPDLVRFAVAEAKPLFARNCASCHGADMKGNKAIGAPDLTDNVWIYGDDTPYQIERTILYGIRSGHPKGHDITEMPAYGQRGQLSDTDINNVIQYLMQLNGRPFDSQAAGLGHATWDKAVCYDCHGSDGKGNLDYGAPDLTANVWAYGGDPRALYDSIYYGRHGTMPAWIGKLTLEQIRALAVYVHVASHR